MSDRADFVDALMRAEGSPERAVQSQAYLKSDLTFYGASVGAVRGAVKNLRRREGDLAHDEVTLLAAELWAEPVHERRLAAVFVLQTYLPLLGFADLTRCEQFLREARTWALIDPLAIDVVGMVIESLDDAQRPRADAVLDRWARDDDFWLRRSALLSPLRALKAGDGDWPRFARHADALLEDREFFVRKAIGWVLRETGRRRPDLVADWLLPRAHRAAGLTVAEAVKHLPAGQAAAIVAARGVRVRPGP